MIALAIASLIAAAATVLAAVIGWRQRRAALLITAAILAPISVSLAALWLLIPVFTAGFLGATGPEPVPCEAAVRFIDQDDLPTGSAESSCTHAGFQDSIYTVDFVVDRQALQYWLDGLPGKPALAQQGCAAGTELCIDQVSFVPRAAGGADYAELDAELRLDGKLRVHLVAFNT